MHLSVSAWGSFDTCHLSLSWASDTKTPQERNRGQVWECHPHRNKPGFLWWRPGAFERHTHPQEVGVKCWLLKEGGTRMCLLSAVSQIPTLQVSTKTATYRFFYQPTLPQGFSARKKMNVKLGAVPAFSPLSCLLPPSWVNSNGP